MALRHLFSQLFVIKPKESIFDFGLTLISCLKSKVAALSRVFCLNN